MIEAVLSTILHPGVNTQTYNVLNVTLGVLFLVISIMLFSFDAIESKFRLHLWIFLAVCFLLILSVNWFFHRYQLYGQEDDEEDEETEAEAEVDAGAEEKSTITKKADKEQRQQQIEAEEEEEEEEKEEVKPASKPAKRTRSKKAE